MIRSEWDALRSGDRVHVHEPPFPATAATSGRVLRITAWARMANDIAIRLDSTRRGDGSGRVVRPFTTAVHREPIPSDGSCWRCAEVAARPGPARDERLPS